MAWKNGGGETVEVAVHPPDAGLAGFDWRVSMATVAADGPFSLFSGVDRTLAILSGNGMELAIDGREAQRLGREREPLGFPADVPASACLLDGAVTDLNAMTRRDRFVHRMRRLQGSPESAVAVEGRWVVILATGPASLTVDDHVIAFEAFDAIVLNGRAAVVRQESPASIFVIEIDAVR